MPRERHESNGYENKDGGIFHKNFDKEKDNQPDIKGFLRIDGQMYWVSGWGKRSTEDGKPTKACQEGDQYYSISLEKAESRGGQGRSSRGREDRGRSRREDDRPRERSRSRERDAGEDDSQADRDDDGGDRGSRDEFSF